jgi:hypothetical protein
VGSAPDYELIASGVEDTSYIYESADLEEVEQVTFRITAIAADGRESGGTTTVRLQPDETGTRVLRIDGDVIQVGAGDGGVDGVLAADGAYTVGMSWRSSVLTEVRLAASEDRQATLRSEMFTAPVRVYRADGRPADHSVDGDVLTLPTRAGESYRIVAQAVVTADVPEGTQLPRSSVPISVTLDAADHQTMPATEARLEGPTGWTVDPESVKLRPTRPGHLATAEFTVAIPAGTPDGRYRMTAVVASDEWSVQVPFEVEVLWPNLALGKPATQSSLGSGGVPERAVDGDTNGAWSGGSVTHTAFEDQPWWQVDLGESHQIDEIAIWGRTDGCCVDRLTDYHVLVSDEPFVSGSLHEVLAQPGVWASHQAGPPTPESRIEVGEAGRYVRVQLAGNNALSLAEVQVFPGVRQALSGPESVLVWPAESTEVSATFYNHRPEPVTNVEIALSAPAGWTVEPSEPRRLDSVPAESGATVDWQVTAPEDTPGGTHELSITASFHDSAGSPRSQAVVPAAVPFGQLTDVFDNVGISADDNTNAADLDGAGSSLSVQALEAAGVTPGSTVTHAGVSFTWPGVPVGEPDNAVASGEGFGLSGTGDTLGFLATSTYGTSTGTGAVFYADGTTQQFTMTVPDWFSVAPADSDPAIVMPYRNRPGNTQQERPSGINIFFVGVPLQEGKTVRGVVLPDVSAEAVQGQPAMHIFAIGIG